MKSHLLTIIFIAFYMQISAQQSFEVNFEHVDKTVFGTFTIPNGEGPFPTIIIIPGTGANDRNGTIPMLGDNIVCLYPDLLNETLTPYKDLGDAMVDSGFAVLRYDKLEFTYPTNLGEISFNKLWFPGESAIDYLKTRTEVDTNRIVLIGHSEGSSLIPIMGKNRDDVSALISLGGPRTPFDSLLAYQLVNIAETCGGNVSQAETQANQILAYYNLIRTNTWNSGTPMIFGVPASVWYDYVLATDAVAQNYNEAELPTLFIGLELDINVPPAELTRFEEEVNITNDFWLIPELNHYLTPNDNPRVAKALTDTIVYWLRQNGLLTNVNHVDKSTVDFSLFPNPTHDKVTIQLNSQNNELIRVEVLNSLGQLIIEHELMLSDKQILLNVSDLPKGVYHLIMKGKSQVRSRRLIKD